MEKNSITFSIIIPYKNTSEYIEKCLNSIREQTFEDFEAICVNDYSTDGTSDIVKSFAEKDERFKNIKLVSKEEGPGTARNLAIKRSKGIYLVFVDSDDWADSKLLEKLADAYKQADDVDGIWYNYSEVFNDTNYIAKKSVKNEYLKITPQNILDYPGYVWAKSYKTDFVRKNNISFMENVYFEDDYFYFNTAFHNPKIYCINENLYYYRRNTSSITGNANTLFKRNNHFFKVVLKIYEDIVKNNYDTDYKETVIKFATSYVSQYKTENPFLIVEFKRFLAAVKKMNE